MYIYRGDNRWNIRDLRGWFLSLLVCYVGLQNAFFAVSKACNVPKWDIALFSEAPSSVPFWDISVLNTYMDYTKKHHTKKEQ